MAGRKHGSLGQVLMDPAGGTTYVAVADLNSWTLNMSRDRVDVTAFGDTNKQSVQGLPDFTGTIGGFWNSATSPAIFDAILGTTAVGLKLVPNSPEPTFFFSGLAYLDGNISVESSGAVSLGASFVAAGNWTATP
jgi:hypothetical protein